MTSVESQYPQHTSGIIQNALNKLKNPNQCLLVSEMLGENASEQVENATRGQLAEERLINAEQTTAKPAWNFSKAGRLFSFSLIFFFNM